MKKKIKTHPHPLYKNNFKKWFLTPYYGKTKVDGRCLKLDMEHCWWHGDRKRLSFFLVELIAGVYEALKWDKKECHFLLSGDLDTECDCRICKRLWKGFYKAHIECTCKNCGFHFWIPKNGIPATFKKEHIKKFKKYNVFDYCFDCAERLSVLDTKYKKWMDKQIREKWKKIKEEHESKVCKNH